MSSDSLSSHLFELRTRFLWMFFVVFSGSICFFYIKESLLDFLVRPLALAQDGKATLISIGVAELFFVYVKISFLSSLFVCLPYLIWHIWRFIAPGLYQHERLYVYPFMFATPLLFYLGGVFTYFKVMPLVVSFFFSFSSESVHQLPAVNEYLKFFMKMTFAFGIAFQLPVVILLLLRFGAMTLKGLKNARRYVYVVIFILAAVLTPPDPASQLMLAIPLLFLFELSYFSAVIFKIGEIESSKN